MPKNLYRYLGCAFASADLLLELAEDQTIVFAMGAAERVTQTGAADLKGKSWREIIAEDDHPLVESILASLSEGGRRGPVNVELASQPGQPRRVAAFSVCKLPQLAPHLSCALSVGPALQGMINHGTQTAGPDKLHDADSLGALAKGMWEVARGTGINVDVCLVEVKGLQELAEERPEEGRRAMRSLAGALRGESYGGASAALLAPDRYALLREQGGPVGQLVEQINAAVGRALGPTNQLAVDASKIAFEPLDTEPEQAFRALRFAVDRFIHHGLADKPPGSLGEVFQELVTDTMNRAGAFKAIVESRKFRLAFQPIVTLADGTVHHHEVLARFAEGESPFGIIRLAEEMDLIEKFDIVMIESVIERLKQRDGGPLHLAVNISGQSLMSPAFIEGLTRLLASHPGLSKQLMFEVTESAALTDLTLADRHIQVLRRAGFQVCLDDFGAGAASFPYLKMLTVDAVKIDGQYIRELGHSERDRDLVRHLVNMCKSLGVSTTAEMVETREVAERLKELEIDFAQGYFYGKPESQPVAQSPSLLGRVLFRAKRKGEVRGWG